MYLELHTALLGIRTQHMVDFQQMVSICLVTRDATDCSGVLGPANAVDHEMERWLPHSVVSSRVVHLMNRTVHHLVLSGITRVASLLRTPGTHSAIL